MDRSGHYDESKVKAFTDSVIMLAEANGLNLLELMGAVAPVYASCRALIRVELQEMAKRAEGPGE